MGSRLELIRTDLLMPNVENPRHAAVATPRDAVAALMDKMPRKILNLARDIGDYGLDPSSLPIVVEHDEYYIALEGNRRIAALLLMKNPNLVELAPPVLAGFQALHDSDVVPDEVACVLFDDREEADHWIELRHTGENDGAGTVRWGAPEQQRFRRQRGSQTDVAMRFAEAMRTLYPDETEFLRDVDTVEAEVSTTLGRVVQNPERRAQLGFDQRDGVLFLRYDPNYVLPLLERLFRDLATGAENVTNLRDRTYMDGYIARILREVPHRDTRLPEPVAVGQWVAEHRDRSRHDDDGAEDGQDGEEEGDGGHDPDDEDDEGTPGRRRQRVREERHIFQGIRLSSVELRVQDVLTEAQRLDIDTSPNLCSIMLRVVVDLVASNFYAFLGRSNADNSELKTKIRSCMQKIDSTYGDPALARARELIESDGALSPKTMNGFVHGWNKTPLASDVRAISAAYGPLLSKIDDYMRDHPKS